MYASFLEAPPFVTVLNLTTETANGETRDAAVIEKVGARKGTDVIEKTSHPFGWCHTSLTL